MRAFGFHEHGGLENLQPLEVPDPGPPGPGQVLVNVRAVSLNRLDMFVLEGWPGLDLPKPHWGGCDASGVVASVGAGVTTLAVGDRVLLDPGVSCGACPQCLADEPSLCETYQLIGEHMRGGLADQMLVPAGNLHVFPESLSFEEAAAFPLTFMTAWRALITRGRLRAGEHVLIVGAGGGVNTAAIQIAKFAGARVTVIAGGSEKCEHAHEIGADHVIDYTEEPKWEKAVLKATGGHGVDLVFDNVGKVTWIRSLKSAAKGGRVVTVGGTTGYDPSAGINYVMWKQLDIVGSTMANRREFVTVRDLVFAGKLHPVIADTVPLDGAADAFATLAKGENVGKLVITMD